MATETPPNDKGNLDIGTDEAFWTMLKNLTGDEVFEEPITAALRNRGRMTRVSSTESVSGKRPPGGTSR